VNDVPPEDPSDALPPDAEPPKSEPANADPANAEPANAGPANAEPANAEPAEAGPAVATEAAPEPAVIELSSDVDHERPGGLLSKVAQNVVMYHDSTSVLAEQYRQCRTNITVLNKPGAPWVLAVTSSRKGEGKSVTVANLAVSLAELPGTRVCLLDADSRSPQVAGFFGLEPEFGLTEYLRDDVPFKDVLNKTLIDNLDCVAAGGEAKNPAELLGTVRFSQLIENLRRRYSWILIDTPPVNPFTDAAVVSALANGTLLVVRLKETPRALVNSTIDSLTTAGGKVIGSMVTGTTPDDEDAQEATYYTDAAHSKQSLSESSAVARDRRRTERKLIKKEKAVLRKRGKEAHRPDDDEFPV
jgi:capsular exopolysaccharide synthesis family protein